MEKCFNKNYLCLAILEKSVCDTVPLSFQVWKKRWVQIGSLQLICTVIWNFLSFYQCKSQILTLVKGYKHPGYNSLLCLSIKASKISDIHYSASSLQVDDWLYFQNPFVHFVITHFRGVAQHAIQINSRNNSGILIPVAVRCIGTTTGQFLSSFFVRKINFFARKSNNS